MRKPTNAKPKRPKDPSQWAHQIVQESIKEESTQETPVVAVPTKPPTPPDLHKYMAEMGRKGGLKGGKKRMALLSDEQKSDLASKAAYAMWAKKRAKS
jgi:hypothetical protein